jgi:hypothetical protein
MLSDVDCDDLCQMVAIITGVDICDCKIELVLD